jgi:hypothetical protein
MIIALVASLLVAVPGGAALAAACCQGETGPLAMGAVSEPGSDPLAAASALDNGTMAPTDSESRPGHHHGPAPEPDRGLPLSAAPTGGAGHPGEPTEQSPPACGLTACQPLPQAALVLTAFGPSLESPSSALIPDTDESGSGGFLDSILRPPRS